MATAPGGASGSNSVWCAAFLEVVVFLWLLSSVFEPVFLEPDSLGWVGLAVFPSLFGGLVGLVGFAVFSSAERVKTPSSKACGHLIHTTTLIGTNNERVELGQPARPS